VLLDDGSCPREVTVYADVLEAQRGKIVTDEVLVVEGKVSKDDFNGEDGLRIVADRLYTLGEARARHARALQLCIGAELPAASGALATAERLQALLSPFCDGGCPVRVRYRNAVAEADLPLGEAWRVRPEDALLESLREWLSPEAVEMLYG
jgi:DNA polymerase-3 subunit alpha